MALPLKARELSLGFRELDYRNRVWHHAAP